MRNQSLSAILLLLIFPAGLFAQFPYYESFDSYAPNTLLNGDGGIQSSAHVWVTPYGVYQNCADFKMTDTAIAVNDTLTSPIIGPLTSHTATSFYFRAVTFPGSSGAPVRYQMHDGDQAIIYVGTTTFAIAYPQYTIDSSDQNPTATYIKVTVPAPSFVSGLNGRFRIVAYNPNGHNWRLEFDSMAVWDTLPVIIPPTLTDSSLNVNCRNDSTGWIKVFASGGHAPYRYNWSNGSNTQTIGHLAAGVYTITVTDSLNATATLSDTIRQPQYALLIDSFSKSDVKCYGLNSGWVTIYATGGTLPLHYLWNNIPPSSSRTAQNLTAGNYNVTITDALGCSVTATTAINQPLAPLTATSSSTPSAGANGTATVIPNGGTSPFSYRWSTTPAQTAPVATGLAPGDYIVTITDANGCQLYDTVFVGYPAGIEKAENPEFSLYPNPADAGIYLEINGKAGTEKKIIISDLSGRVIITSEQVPEWLNVSALSAGVYWIRVETDGVSATRKLIIQR